MSLKRLEKLIDIRSKHPSDGGTSDVGAGNAASGNAASGVVLAVERPTRKVSVSSMPPVIEMRSASFGWTENREGFKLVDISLSVNPGRIVGQ